MSVAPGTRLGRYEITAQIGVGGMGEVYRATDTSLGRPVAIKVLPETFAQDPERLARFEREARTLATLNHTNIAIVHGLETADPSAGSEQAGIRLLVMELVEGPTLADRIRHGPIPVDESLSIAKQVAQALEAAHEQGIIHRDLKPANIKLRPDGVVKVLDFGLAKALEPMSAHSADVTASPTITPDGAEILFREAVPNSGQGDLMRLLMGSPQRPASAGVSTTATPLVQTMFEERNAELSPKGQWLAYESNESGRFEVYVRPFPDVGSGRWLVSTSGGQTPLWARSGEELFYVAPDGTIHGVRVEGSSSWRSSSPTKVLQGNYLLPQPSAAAGRTFDIAADGKRFLMIKAASGSDAPAPQSLIVVENWFEELRQRVPTER